MAIEQIIERIYRHLEDDAVESAVMGCVRVARAAKDFLNAAVFLRELHPERDEVVRALYEDISHLRPEAIDFIMKTSTERWLELHDLGFTVTGGDEDHLPEGQRRTVLKVAVGEIDHELAQWEATISDMAIPSGMSSFDVAAFTDQFTREKAQMRLRIKALQTIKARIKARCLNYAIQMERQTKAQRESQGLLETVQNDVNNYFKVQAEDVFLKLQKATALATSPDLEDAALLLTEVRRALKSDADHFYPPVSDPVLCSDGQTRRMGDEQYLNRLHQFVMARFERSTAQDLIRSELEHLGAFLRRLNEMASKGVHSSATLAESRQGLVGLYFFLFNLTQHLTTRDATG